MTQLAEWVRHGLHLADIGNVGDEREQFHRSHAVKGPIPDQDDRELLVRHRRAAQPRIPHPVTGPWEHVSPRGDARVGHGLRIGTLGLRVDKRDQRCVIGNVNPLTVRRDPAVLRAIARQRQVCRGVYGSVVATGRVAVGDPVVLDG